MSSDGVVHEVFHGAFGERVVQLQVVGVAAERELAHPPRTSARDRSAQPLGVMRCVPLIDVRETWAESDGRGYIENRSPTTTVLGG